MKELIKKILEYRGYHYQALPKQVDSFKTEFATVPQYGIETDKYKLTFWNSSNEDSINNPQEVMKQIAVELLDNIDAEDEMDWIMEGEVNDGWNTIMFEVKER